MDIDDFNKTTHFWREGSNDILSRYKEENSSPETSMFRGFEKEPVVLIERFDLESFINISSKFGCNSPNVKLKTLPQLVSDCYVKLVNEDLEQLKKDVLENSRLKKLNPNGVKGEVCSTLKWRCMRRCMNVDEAKEVCQDCSKWQSVVSAYPHGTQLNMPSLHCKICEKAYKSEKKLQNHLENKHMLVYKARFSRNTHKRVSFSDNVVVHEIQEYHKCRKCTKIFKQYQTLKAHMKQEHRKRKCYICHYCSRNFVDRMFFKGHIKLHCDVCGLLLPNKRSYMSHRRDVCRVIKKYLCKTCENVFFSYMGLKDHSYDHVKDLFVCDICKERHSSKCALAHHILFLHSKRRSKHLYTDRKLGNERLYLCNFCDVSSIDKHVLEKHVSTLPDLNNKKRTDYKNKVNKDYYFCDHCSKEFETESDMLQHKWTHFLNTSENSQVQEHNKCDASENSQVQGHNKCDASENSQVQGHNKCEEDINSAEKQNEIQKIYKITEKLPILMQPKIVLERLHFVKPHNTPESVDSNNIDSQETTESPQENDKPQNTPESMDSNNIDSQETTESPQENETVFEVGITVKKAIVDPKSKKTLISKFQCQKCLKYYSNNYCLNRHMLAMHSDYSNINLQCHVCEESFVWPSLLKSHKCIRMNIPEMPFDDARPEIQFDNYRHYGEDGFDELMNISQNEDYMNSVDFEIPAPVGGPAECEKRVNARVNNVNENSTPVHNSYKIVMQEVPIEF